MLRRLLLPFARESSYAWVWLLVLGLAPLAYWTALRLPVAQVREPHVGSAEALRRAIDFGKALGLRVQDWRAAVQPMLGAEHALLAGTGSWMDLPPARRSLAPITTIRVVLVSPDKRHWFAVWLRPDGSIHGYDTSPGLMAWGTIPPEAESRLMAMREASRAFPEQRWGEPEVETGAVQVSHGARRYLWRTPVLPGVESTLTVEVQGDRITERTVKVKVNRGELPVRSSRFNGIFGSLAGLALAAGVLYAVYRFSRRALEREISWIRSGILVGLSTALALIVVAADPLAGTGQLPPERFTTPFAMLLPLIMVLGFTLQGIVLALVYGAGEGEIRESYPGKITSLDAIFTGYVTSANVGRSLVIGAATGGWAFLAVRLVRFATGQTELREHVLGMAYGGSPWLRAMITEAVAALFLACLCLMLPLLYLSRHLGRSALRRGLAILLCFLGSVASGGGVNFDEPATIAMPVVISALALATFWYGDFLAAVVGLWWFFAFVHNQEMAQVVAAWAPNAHRIYALGILSLVLGVVMLYRGRKLSDAEVRPQHAHRIQERLQLEQEVLAAREAQVRLLPEVLPEVPGFALAASCHPAREVGGDFYDFYQLSRQRCGILVADGSSGGLASALTIGLAKGFLSYAAQRDWAPGLALERLQPVLTQAISSTSHHFSLCYAVLDPGMGEIRVARIGSHPRVFHCSQQRRAAGVNLVGEVQPDAGEVRVALSPGDLLLFCTDGLTSRLESRLGCKLDDWLDQLNNESSKTAERFHSDLMRSVNAMGGDLQDDLTVVVIEMQVPQLQSGTGVELRGVA